MPVQKKKPSNVALLRQEIEELKEAIDDLHDDVLKFAPKTGIKKVSSTFLNGIIRGVGVLIGTLIVGSILFFALHQALKTDVVQNWIDETIRNAVQSSIENALPDVPEDVIRVWF